MHVGLKKMGTEQRRPGLRVGTAIALYCQNDKGVYHVFRRVFSDRRLVIGYFEWGLIDAEDTEIPARRTTMAQSSSCSSAFDMLRYFLALLFLEGCMRTNLVSTVRNWNSCMQGGYAILVVMKTINSCPRAAVLKSI